MSVYFSLNQIRSGYFRLFQFSTRQLSLARYLNLIQVSSG
jgi:hypothetical protein